MFLSAVVPLVVTQTVEQAEYAGRACHAFFLQQVARHNSDLAAELHHSRGAKCFTVSPLMVGETWQSGRRLEQGARLWMRFTSLDPHLSRLMRDMLLPALPEAGEFGPVLCRLGEPILANDEHPWAADDKPEALMNRWFGSEHLPDSVVLRFSSPTASRRIHRDWLLPLPEVVFASLLQRWNRYSHHPFDESILRLVAADVYVAHYRLQTATVHTGTIRQPGWMGQVRYRIHAREPGLRAALHTLADFAVFSGTGYKTTQGMGQTRALD